MSSSKVNQTLSAELKRAVSALQNGQMVLLVDDEGRENEGDLVAAGQFVTPEIVNFMITNAKGLLCMPLQRELAQKLRLPLMVQQKPLKLLQGMTSLHRILFVPVMFSP